MRPLSRDFYMQDAQSAARQLLGKLVVREVAGRQLILRITETEGYLGADDPACHSYQNRRTARTEVMYGLGGYSYIYLIYGMYYLLNAVTGERDDPCAVLIRAGEPVAGLDTISRNRFGRPWEALSKTQRRTISDGPGKLSRALGIGREQNKVDLTRVGSELFIRAGGDDAPFEIHASARIGVDYAGQAARWPLNFRLRKI